MADTNKQIVGKKGEEAACAHLIGLGYRIIDRNYWRKWGEIDIVAGRGSELRFVEVKTVTRNHLANLAEDYEPEDNLHPWKRARLRRVIATYLTDKNVSDDLDWQVDALTVYLNPQGVVLKIEHLEDLLL